MVLSLRTTGNDGGRRHNNRTPSGAAGSAAASSNNAPDNDNNNSKPTPKKKKKKPKQTKKEEHQSHEPVRRTVKPQNQLVLTDAERAADVSLLLTAADPNRPKNAVVSFSHRDMCFKPDPPGQGDNMAVHFGLAGSMMHVDSDECRKYGEAEARSREREEALLADEGGDGAASSSADGSATTAGGVVRADRAKNQFNFSERATQSYNNPQKERAVHTEPPPVTQYSDEVSQWMIFDSYKSDFLLTESMEKSDSVRNLSFEDRLASIVSSSDEGGDPSSSSSGGSGRGAVDTIHSESMESALKTMERLVNQNAEDEIFQDFKYFEDRADSIRRGEGTLLPLWKFASTRSSRKQVTSLAWNPRYDDLFAVSYGSYDFLRQGSGMVCCFSLKNTSHPEYVIHTESGAMCLDFHPRHPSLVAVGCYDGTVLAYDIGERSSRPIYSSSLRSGKHSDPVWEVRWHDDPASSSSPSTSKELSFYSVSSDGRVASWAMSKNELKMEPIMHLKLINPASKREDYHLDGGGEPTLSGLAGGCTFDFNGKLENLFLVGTEEGSIHECSRAYSGQYINTYDGHHMGVHAVRWNPFHEDIFISCSADWTVKIWDHGDPKCLLHFDLGNAVGDVCWSPYSSTVFAAVTTDGRVHVFDLAQNKRDPLCAQRIVKKSRLTNAAFNLKDFILIAGDDRGAVHSLKLSPNLRREVEAAAAEEEGDEAPDMDMVQRSRLRGILASIDKKYADT